MNDELAVSRKRIRSNESEDNRPQAKYYVDQKVLDLSSIELMKKVHGKHSVLYHFLIYI